MPAMDNRAAPTTILVKWPTRERPALFRRQFNAWRQRQSGLHQVHYLITLDSDDATMTDQLAEIASSPDVRAVVGPPSGKVGACNRDMEIIGRLWPDLKPDIVMLASDDMTPIAVHWDQQIVRDMDARFPLYDGALHYHDGYLGGDTLITLSILGWNLYRRFGYLYHPSYKSLWCDNEFTDVVRVLGKYRYSPQTLFRHDHIGRQPDSLHRKNESFFQTDGAMYNARKARGFDLSTPLLSILIPTLRQRTDSFNILANELHRQIFTLGQRHGDVELHAVRDRGEQTVGAKRNELLNMARGKFVVFIDDDDRVAPSYVSDILDAIGRNPLADCIGLAGDMSIDGQPHAEFDHSLQYTRNTKVNGVYLQPPNHLSPILREIALQVKFPAWNCHEDAAYSRGVAKLLRCEESIRDTSGGRKRLYHYQFRNDGTATQNAHSRFKVLYGSHSSPANNL
ncbi:MAG: glycosyltransferase family A protein [Planctomycetia bacterium]|nr:glycosyltransferase family A protein [Planctomycetia bacterium]